MSNTDKPGSRHHALVVGSPARRCASTAAISTARATSRAIPVIVTSSEAVAKVLPRRAIWVASSLMRTHQTAQAIWDTGFPKPAAMSKEAAFAEQHLGQWQGMNRAADFWRAVPPVQSTGLPILPNPRRVAEADGSL